MMRIVQIHSQADKTEHTLLPDSFKEIDSRDTDTESEEDVYDEGDNQPWEDQASQNQITSNSDTEQSEEDNHSSSRVSRRKARALFMTNKERHPLDHKGEHLQKEKKQEESLGQCWKKSEKENSEFVVLTNLLWRKSEGRLGEELLQLCAERAPDIGAVPGTDHQGRDRTTQRILDEYFWRGVHTDVKNLYLAFPEVSLPGQTENHL